MDKKPPGKPGIDHGEQVRLALTGNDGRSKNYLAQKFIKYDGQSGTVISTASYPADDKTILLCDVRLGNETVQVTEDCLKPVESRPGHRGPASV